MFGGLTMAVPAAQPGTSRSPGQRPPESDFVVRIQKPFPPLVRSLFAVILAMIAGGLVIFFTQGGSFSAVVNGYQTLFTGAFGTGQNISYTLVNVTQLALCGLSVAIAFRAGLFNIGAEGQLAVGAMTAAII